MPQVQKKYLNLNGLTIYDEEIKDYVGEDIINITRSGSVFTVTRKNGTTFTFDQLVGGGVAEEISSTEPSGQSVGNYWLQPY